ncbi:MAG TPA: hypothetical protein VL588_11945 [Bdellovibrionota bacterium]|jgi:hypothetical protein|nr:hypothetical protein [Bdellovibrionota bacterium]
MTPALRLLIVLLTALSLGTVLRPAMASAAQTHPRDVLDLKNKLIFLQDTLRQVNEKDGKVRVTFTAHSAAYWIDPKSKDGEAVAKAAKDALAGKKSVFVTVEYDKHFIQRIADTPDPKAPAQEAAPTGGKGK